MSGERTDLVRAEENAGEWRNEAMRLRGELNAIREELGLPVDRLPAERPPMTTREVIVIRGLRIRPSAEHVPPAVRVTL